MTSLDPKTPLHEPSSEQRRQAGRMVWLIVLGLPTVIGVMVAYLSVKGRQVREYGKAVLQSIENSPSTFVGPDGLACQDVDHFRKPPSVVKSCRVSRVEGGLLVTLDVDGGRQYQVSNVGGKLSDKVGRAVSVPEVDAYAHRVANDFPAWVKANNPPALEVQSVPCVKVSSAAVPAGVGSCVVQAGPADGPEVAVKLVDGQSLTVAIP